MRGLTVQARHVWQLTLHYDVLIHKGDCLVHVWAARPSAVKHKSHSADNLYVSAREAGALAVADLMAPCSRRHALVGC